MLNHRLDRDHRILTLAPHGPLSQSDFEKISHKIDPFIEESGDLNGILIKVEQFPGWEDFYGLIGHLKFVRAHHQRVKKVALVTGDKMIHNASQLAGHFVNADIRAFEEGEDKEALHWLRSDSSLEGVERGVEILNFADEPVIGMRIVGKIHKADILAIEEALEPKLEHWQKLSIYVELQTFQWITWGALWEDLSFGIKHLDRFSKKAVVGESIWMKRLGEGVNNLFPQIEFRWFEPQDTEAAKVWARAPA